jgi:hypothetical protein
MFKVAVLKKSWPELKLQSQKEIRAIAEAVAKRIY